MMFTSAVKKEEEKKAREKKNRKKRREGEKEETNFKSSVAVSSPGGEAEVGSRFITIYKF